MIVIGICRVAPASRAVTGRRSSLYRASLLFSLLLASLLAPGSAAARVPAPDLLYTPATQVDLSNLIDKLQNKYSRMQGLASDFMQIYRGPDGRTLRESGRLLLKRPGKARWEYISPRRKLFISDGRNIYFYVEGERHATQVSVRQSADPQIPFLFLLGRGNLRRDFSRIEMLSDERATEAGNVVLKLVPKRAPEEFKQLLVGLARLRRGQETRHISAQWIEDGFLAFESARRVRRAR
jgi:outer membrane lipoprotein-sorting protein